MKLVGIHLDVLDEELKFIYYNRGKGLIGKNYNDVKELFESSDYIINLDKEPLGNTARIYFSEDIDSKIIENIKEKLKKYLDYNREVTVAKNRLLGFDLKEDVLEELISRNLGYWNTTLNNFDKTYYVYNKLDLSYGEISKINKETWLRIKELEIKELSKAASYYIMSNSITDSFKSCYSSINTLISYISAKYNIKPNDYIRFDVSERSLNAVLVQCEGVVEKYTSYYVGYDTLFDTVGAVNIHRRDILFSFNVKGETIIWL